jgi:hypothetical protein
MGYTNLAPHQEVNEKGQIRSWHTLHVLGTSKGLG